MICIGLSFCLGANNHPLLFFGANNSCQVAKKDETENFLDNQTENNVKHGQKPENGRG